MEVTLDNLCDLDLTEKEVQVLMKLLHRLKTRKFVEKTIIKQEKPANKKKLFTKLFKKR